VTGPGASERVVLLVPELEELRRLTDAAWDWHFDYANRARRSLGRPLPCPVCLHDPTAHLAPSAEKQFAGCSTCAEAKFHDCEPAACPMTADLIALAYSDRGYRTYVLSGAA
jgi:hypothetical protein